MCDFISWIEREGHIYLFTNKELNTKEGRKIQKGLKDNDVRGHGVIREYWGLKDGVNKECEDFSTPDNFPKEIVKAVKLGQYSEIGFNLDLLNSAGKAEYEKIRQPALVEYKKIEQSALAEYEKIEQPALAEYEKIEQPALAEYKKIEQPAWAEYEKIKQTAFWDIFKHKKYRNKKWL